MLPPRPEFQSTKRWPGAKHRKFGVRIAGAAPCLHLKSERTLYTPCMDSDWQTTVIGRLHQLQVCPQRWRVGMIVDRVEIRVRVE